LAGVGAVERLALAGEDGDDRLALDDRRMRFLPAQIIGQWWQQDAGRRLPLRHRRPVEALSGGAATDDQQQ
jgi:hypothetical protein